MKRFLLALALILTCAQAHAFVNAADRLLLGSPPGNILLFGNGEGSYYSLNSGSSWTSNSLPVNCDYEGGYWNGAVYVLICGSSTHALYSGDGISWTEVSFPVNASVHYTTYGLGMFITTMASSSYAISTNNGASWTSETSPCGSSCLQRVGANSSIFCAAQYSSNKAWYSSNGTSWTSSTLPSTHDWYNVAWNQSQGVFLATAAGENTNIVATSPDCQTWTSHTLPSYFSSAEQDGGGTNGTTFVVLGNGGGSCSPACAAVSSDGGSTWTQALLPFSCGYGFMTPPAWTGKVWFAGCYQDTSNPPRGMTSPDGLNWTEVNLPYVSGEQWSGFIVAPNVYLQN